MIKRHKLFGSLYALMLLSSAIMCLNMPQPVWAQAENNAKNNANPSEAALKSEVGAFLSHLLQTMSSLNAEALSAQYLQSEETSLVVNGKFYQGQSQIAQRLSDALTQFKSLQISTEPAQIVMLHQDQALAYYTFTGLGQNKSSKEFGFAGATSLILIKTPMGWKILHEHTSPNIPG